MQESDISLGHVVCSICAEMPLAQSVLTMRGSGELSYHLLNVKYPLTSFMTNHSLFYRHNRHIIAARNLRRSYSTTQRGKPELEFCEEF